ncbi:MAG: hypothetical protein UT77_C0001G0234 [Candidatus Daviesbacteria bacterium GW2011_GWC2_40_12]|uniref:Uncharacterized protein n=1 Tax=Candidatus Daviesbacteria bacterium GW2011_GWC2_40_12 TaxID=1618431 RepID=A0A0G0QRL3_9BACT|nr:MAG: hypothetical protein UT45_C0001G0081 [Candidatus Daviesbacteria bacterium GW2011_GWA2_39_33]KKR42783.1 MAG: hypothetical protein UT77_C0001G0234 [Candidatus Daviesbacteria bacterium GW2011_GWC2_40_12]
MNIFWELNLQKGGENMATKNNSGSNLIVYLVVAVLVGGFIGYLIGQNNKPFSQAYMNQTASMMKDNGSTMMQMGKMMMSGGAMMQQKGQAYGDQEMMQQGKELEENGQMMQTKGNSMSERGTGMTQMMGQ